jgi:hypothetical protein
MKTFTILYSLILLSCAISSSTKSDYKEYTIINIDFLDDGQPIIYVETDSIRGIIISQDTTNLGLLKTKIKVGRKYLLKLKQIERNFRGQNDAYGLQSLKGTQKIIWREKENIPLVLYKSYNLSGLKIYH